MFGGNETTCHEGMTMVVVTHEMGFAWKSGTSIHGWRYIVEEK
jgi:ABC-type polar amino acid transport system ATPase subunit